MSLPKAADSPSEPQWLLASEHFAYEFINGLCIDKSHPNLSEHDKRVTERFYRDRGALDDLWDQLSAAINKSSNPIKEKDEAAMRLRAENMEQVEGKVESLLTEHLKLDRQIWPSSLTIIRSGGQSKK
ncbi:MAG: hypothetical protein Q9168_004743 [Polycauliona sp. 1 TL-2023]